MLPVIGLGAGGSGLLVLWWVNNKLAARTISRQYHWLLNFGLGCVFGLATNLLTVILMIFKNVRHAHLFPDYSAALMGEVLERAPAWTLAGGLLGLGAALLWFAHHFSES